MNKLSKAALAFGPCVLVLAGLYSAISIGGYRINVTPSYPRGLWRIEPLTRPLEIGDRVIVCPPANFPKMALEREYVPPGPCASGTSPLLKRVVGLPNQRVSVSDQIRIDGIPITGSKVFFADGAGRALSSWPGNQIPAGTVFLHANKDDSYDSRYFGPLPVEGVLGLAIEVFTLSE